MTTQTTTIRTSTTGIRALIGATAAGLAVLGGALLWQGRPAGETADSVATTSIGAVAEGVAPMGGLAEHYRDQGRATAAAAAARVTTAGGMAELYAQQASDRYADEAARIGALDGWDAPYRASTQPTCGAVADGAHC